MNLTSFCSASIIFFMAFNAWSETNPKTSLRKPSAAYLSKEEIASLPLVSDGLLCVDDTTPSLATSGLNTSLNQRFNGSYIVVLDEANQKFARISGGRVIGHSITSYSSNDSALKVRFLACALIATK